MASSKRTPKVSKISRERPVAYARKQRPASDPAEAGSDAEDASPAPAENSSAGGSAAAHAGSAAAPAATDKPAVKTDAPAAPAASAPVAPVPAEARSAAAPTAAAATDGVDEPVRARAATVAMPEQAPVGAPPAMPKPAASASKPAAVDVMTAEDPTRLPGPRDIPEGSPGDPARPPGLVPRGDSRSMRRHAGSYEFALVYRMQTFVISRFGEVGTRGQWRVVEYPTSASASHAYAKECSRFVSEGFSDYRE